MTETRIEINRRQLISTWLFCAFLAVFPAAAMLVPSFPLGVRVAAGCWLGLLITIACRPNHLAFPPPLIARLFSGLALVAFLCECLRWRPPTDIRYVDDYLFLLAWLGLILSIALDQRVRLWQRILAPLLLLGGWAAGFFYQVSGGVIGLFGSMAVTLHLIMAFPEIVAWAQRRSQLKPSEVAESAEHENAENAERGQAQDNDLIQTAVTAAGLTLAAMALLLMYFQDRGPRWLERLADAIGDWN